MRVHIGCGSVYLKDYVNVDVRAPGVFLAKDRPDLVEKYLTTEQDYYGRHKDKTIDTMREGPIKEQEYVCDEYGTFADLPGSTWTLSEVLARHVFEHMSITEAHKALDEIDRKMKPGGLLRIDVPDHEETMKLFQKTGDKFYIRHLLGPRRNEYGYHMMSYTREHLKKLVEGHGFRFLKEEPNIHVYPSICMAFVKPGMRPAYEYFPQLAGHVGNAKTILEVGPGRNPWPLATSYMDISTNYLNDIERKVEKISFNLDDRWDAQHPKWDFVYAAHVIEHLKDPLAGIANLERMADRGVIIVPSMFKDFLFNFEEDDHRWWFLETNKGIDIIPVNTQKIEAMRQQDMQKAMTRLMRTGPNQLGEDQRILRNWFFDHEHVLDIYIYWEGKMRIAK